MKAYTKITCPAGLAPWPASGHDWGDFTQDTGCYDSVKTALMDEQHHVCCYCEASLQATDSHIEHFQPRHGPHGNPNRTYDYANLGCSCNGGIDGNRHCGHYKGHNYDTVRFVNPSSEDSDRMFLYTIDGGIHEAPGLNSQEHERARYMIQLLHLDCPRLANIRRSHAHGLQSSIEGLLEAESDAQIDDLALFYMSPDSDGKLQPFFSVSRQIFGEHADIVLSLLDQ